MMWLVFALLTILAATFIVFPLLKSTRKSTADLSSNASDLVEHANVVLFKEQLADLDLQLAEGDIDDVQYAELVSEQKRLLLVDTPANVNSYSKDKSGRGAWLVLVCLLITPILAFSLYQMLGASDDVEITELLQLRASEPMSDEESATLSQKIQAKLSRRILSEPDHIFYLVTLARLQMDEANFVGAAMSYRQAVEVNPNDSELLAEYAQALYFAAGSKFEGEAGAVLDNALALDTNNLTALGLQGIRSFESGEYLLAIRSWQAALKAISPQSSQAQALQSGILRARKFLGEDLPALNVEVALSPDFEATPGQTVYVFAREWQGKPMPLAVAKLLVEELPTTVTLDDSMAMVGGLSLSSVALVEVVARVSTTGSAIPSDGDLEGSTGKLEMNNDKKLIHVVIDRQL
ncbi:MAG: c-type cytochrome biogenesis protein CcmI [Porticoccus sp.]|nr:c-type cytochrome biogenesis protein CcmI [Porticoccus sp.]